MAARGTVLILTGADDPTADAVINALHDRGAAVSRFDLGDFPLNAHISAHHDGRSWQGEITGPGTSVALADIIAVYYRRPSRFVFPDDMSAADQVFADAEARIGVGGVLTSLGCTWISHPHDVARAEWKPLQLHVASSVGLATPRTLISNDARAAREFAREANGPVVCKPLSSIVHTDDGTTRIAYTTIVDPAAIDPTAFSMTAHLLQDWVPKQREARVTVVGRTVLATTITAESERAYIDWRADYANLRYELVDAPPRVVDGMRAYLAAFRLRYGAFDFVITPDGEWVMLECNPAGQWLWLHHAIELPIPTAIAELLTEAMT